MSDHEFKRRIDDDPLLQIFKNWQFYGSVAMVLVAIGGYIASFRMMSTAIEEGQEFQRSQISINTELKTMVADLKDQTQDLEHWRDGMDRWNRRKDE